MREIIRDWCLDKNGRTLFVQIERICPDSFMLSEGLMPPSDFTRGPMGFNFPMEPRSFSSEEEALRYVDGNYLPGRRTSGWMLKEI
jgi:hypothetical protein